MSDRNDLMAWRGQGGGAGRGEGAEGGEDVAVVRGDQREWHVACCG